MHTTIEMVWAEIDYRLERASGGVELEHRSVARELHRPWWRRAFGHRDTAPETAPETAHATEPSDPTNAVRLAA